MPIPPVDRRRHHHPGGPRSEQPRRPTPRTRQTQVASTLTSTRTKRPLDNVGSGQRRYEAHPGPDHPETAKVQCPMTTLAVVNVDTKSIPDEITPKPRKHHGPAGRPGGEKMG